MVAQRKDRKPSLHKHTMPDNSTMWRTSRTNRSRSSSKTRQTTNSQLVFRSCSTVRLDSASSDFVAAHCLATLGGRASPANFTAAATAALSTSFALDQEDPASPKDTAISDFVVALQFSLQSYLFLFQLQLPSSLSFFRLHCFRSDFAAATFCPIFSWSS